MSHNFEGIHTVQLYSIINRNSDFYNASIGVGTLVLNTLKTHVDLFRAFLTEVETFVDHDKFSVTVTPRSRNVWTGAILSPGEMEFDTVSYATKGNCNSRYLALSDVTLTRIYPHEVAY